MWFYDFSCFPARSGLQQASSLVKCMNSLALTNCEKRPKQIAWRLLKNHVMGCTFSRVGGEHGIYLVIVSFIHTHKHICTHIHAHAQTHTHTHECIHTQTNTQAHTHAHTRMQTNTQAHTHTRVVARLLQLSINHTCIYFN